MRARAIGVFAALIAAAGASACSDAPLAPDPNGMGAESRMAPLLAAAPGKGIRGRYIVVMRDGADAAGAARQVVAAHDGELHYTYSRALNGFAATLPAAAVESLRHNPQVAYVEEDGIAKASATQYNAPWGLDRIDQTADGNYDYTAIVSGVRIYVLDTGIRYDHVDFGGRATGGYDAYGGNASDCNGHGTHVAGTAAGSTYGVAKGASLIAVRVLDCNGYGTWSGVIAGIDWVTQYHVKPAVANMSLGGGGNTSVDAAVGNSINAGVTYAVAAGNNAEDACYSSPARVSAALTVASSTSSDERSYFSNFGRCVDLYAPGSGITSAWHTVSTATNTLNGTSMASPHVAGVAALYLQSNPAAAPGMVVSAVVNSASPQTIAGGGIGAPNNRIVNSTLAGYSPPSWPPATSAPTVQFDCQPSGLYGYMECSAYAYGGTGDGYDFSWLTGSGATATGSYAFLPCPSTYNYSSMDVYVTVIDSGGSGVTQWKTVECSSGPM